MPVPIQRDPDLTRKQLAGWIAGRVPGAKDVWVSEIGGPSFTGFSNETLIFDARWTADGTTHEQPLVVRVKPTGHTIFLESAFVEQFRVMSTLHERTDIPMPKTFWYEDDESWLGAPFYAMEKIEGMAPMDNPPYTIEGWLKDARPDQQEKLWWSGLDTMARIHNLDWRALGFEFLDNPARGRTGLDQQLTYYKEYLAWAAQGRPQPIAEATFQWVLDHRPDTDGPLALCWGDSRPSNMLFRDFQCVAVLDWEMVTLGDPVQDLGWWLFLDRHFTEGIPVPQLPGFPSREETVERWEACTGREARHLDYYEVFAGLRFAVVMMRVAQLATHFELLPPDNDLETDNIVTRLLAAMLDLPPPS